MNRLATLLALVFVLAAVSAAISSMSGSTLLLATMLIATGVLVHKFVLSAVAANTAAPLSTFREFLACLFQNLFRFAIGAVVIAWAAVSVLWFFGG